MTRSIPSAVALLLVVGCDQGARPAAAPSTTAPVFEVASSAVEMPAFNVEGADRVDPPPPPTPDELRIDRIKHWYSLLSTSMQTGVTKLCRYRGHNPCAGALPPRRDVPDPYKLLLAAVGPTQQPKALAYCDAVYGRSVCNTPLVVAFDGETVTFVDHWPTATTPWLALDRDGDGAITSRAELFGDHTVLPSGERAPNGFTALAALDDNHDGRIDRSDSTFARLLLWGDRDGNQTSSPAELRPASGVVVEIPLANEMRVRCTAADDCEGERGTLAWRAGDGAVRQGAVIDVYIH
jgi:hypothetical protein